jgi:hypothetical protein
MTLEEAFEARLGYVRELSSQLATRLEIASWQFVPEHVATIRHELDTLTKVWADIKAKRESEANQCQSK